MADTSNGLPGLREALGWSQGRLAQELSVSRQTINAIETGRFDPSLPLALRIAALFERPVETIFRLRDEPEAGRRVGATR